MTCLIVSDQIRVQLYSRDVAVPAEEVTSSSPLASQRSALQRPDMSRLRLASMLRRSSSKAANGARLTWAAMLNRRMEECANSNQ
ncbi:MAG TPA: hypothetical protein VIF12_06370 [Micavibrio sp.]|jgi:hypothetical protein